MLILTEADVRALYSDLAAMRDAIRAVALAHRELAEGRVVLAPRADLSYPQTGPDRRRVQIDSGVLGIADLCVARVLGASRGMPGSPRERQAYVLWRQSDTSLVALIACEWANVMRTGAATGLATDLLAASDARDVAVIGSSRHAHGQLAAILAVRQVDRARVYSPTPEHRESFAREARDRLGIDVVPVGSAEEALQGAEIICGATSQPTTTAIRGRWVRRGAHVNSIGLWNEIDADLATTGRLLVSSKEGVLRATPPSEPLTSLLREGLLGEESVAELTELVVGKRTVRRSSDDISVFVSAGAPLWDAAVAWRIYSLARERGVGRDISLLDA